MRAVAVTDSSVVCVSAATAELLWRAPALPAGCPKPSGIRMTDTGCLVSFPGAPAMATCARNGYSWTRLHGPRELLAFAKLESSKEFAVQAWNQMRRARSETACIHSMLDILLSRSSAAHNPSDGAVLLESTLAGAIRAVQTDNRMRAVAVTDSSVVCVATAELLWRAPALPAGCPKPSSIRMTDTGCLVSIPGAPAMATCALRTVLAFAKLSRRASKARQKVYPNQIVLQDTHVGKTAGPSLFGAGTCFLLLVTLAALYRSGARLAEARVDHAALLRRCGADEGMFTAKLLTQQRRLLAADRELATFQEKLASLQSAQAEARAGHARVLASLQAELHTAVESVRETEAARVQQAREAAASEAALARLQEEHSALHTLRAEGKSSDDASIQQLADALSACTDRLKQADAKCARLAQRDDADEADAAAPGKHRRGDNGESHGLPGDTADEDAVDAAATKKHRRGDNGESHGLPEGTADEDAVDAAAPKKHRLDENSERQRLPKDTADEGAADAADAAAPRKHRRGENSERQELANDTAGEDAADAGENEKGCSKTRQRRRSAKRGKTGDRRGLPKDTKASAADEDAADAAVPGKHQHSENGERQGLSKDTTGEDAAAPERGQRRKGDRRGPPKDTEASAAGDVDAEQAETKDARRRLSKRDHPVDASEKHKRRKNSDRRGPSEDTKASAAGDDAEQAETKHARPLLPKRDEAMDAAAPEKHQRGPSSGRQSPEDTEASAAGGA
eukprot:gene16311-24994_t